MNMEAIRPPSCPHSPLNPKPFGEQCGDVSLLSKGDARLGSYTFRVIYRAMLSYLNGIRWLARRKSSNWRISVPGYGGFPQLSGIQNFPERLPASGARLERFHRFDDLKPGDVTPEGFAPLVDGACGEVT